MVMVFQRIAIVGNATLTGFYTGGSAAPIMAPEPWFVPIETILHGEDQHVLLNGRLKNHYNLSCHNRSVRYHEATRMTMITLCLPCVSLKILANVT